MVMKYTVFHCIKVTDEDEQYRPLRNMDLTGYWVRKWPILETQEGNYALFDIDRIYICQVHLPNEDGKIPRGPVMSRESREKKGDQRETLKKSAKVVL